MVLGDLYAAAAGGDDLGPALGEDVLALVTAPGSEPVAVAVLATEGEDVVVEAELGACAGAAAELGDPEPVVAIAGDAAAFEQAVPAGACSSRTASGCA